MIKIAKIAAAGALIALAASCAPQKIAVTAHRGFWKCEEAGYAENSIKSLELAQQNGFVVREVHPTVLRVENGQPVQGSLVIWQA